MLGEVKLGIQKNREGTQEKEHRKQANCCPLSLVPLQRVLRCNSHIPIKILPHIPLQDTG